jgi:putative FmdB family regulatory protein
MPTYDYLCGGCGHKFEKFQSITRNPLRKCPECKELKLKRLIGSGAGVIFKGTGFYETDYRSKSYTDAKTKAESKPKDKDKPKADTKSEKTKSEGKPKKDSKKKK